MVVDGGWWTQGETMNSALLDELARPSLVEVRNEMVVVSGWWLVVSGW